MIVVVEQYNAHKYQHLIDEMFRLRARIFRDRLNWDVAVTDGKERDRYDDEQPVYIIHSDDAPPARRFWLTFSPIRYRTR
jgi:N-acyl-L-homoserine lactone synthetase